MAQGVCVIPPPQVSRIKGVAISDILVSSLSFLHALLKGQHSSPHLCIPHILEFFPFPLMSFISCISFPAWTFLTSVTPTWDTLCGCLSCCVAGLLDTPSSSQFKRAQSLCGRWLSICLHLPSSSGSLGGMVLSAAGKGSPVPPLKSLTIPIIRFSNVISPLEAHFCPFHHFTQTDGGRRA